MTRVPFPKLPDGWRPDDPNNQRNPKIPEFQKDFESFAQCAMGSLFGAIGIGAGVGGLLSFIAWLLWGMLDIKCNRGWLLVCPLGLMSIAFPVLHFLTLENLQRPHRYWTPGPIFRWLTWMWFGVIGILFGLFIYSLIF
jgi:hypothetical protein